MTNDLKEAKVGDTLWISDRWKPLGFLQTVERITPSGRVITKHAEYNPDGRRRGTSGFDVCYARIATPEDIAKVYRAKVLQKVSHFTWDKLGDDDLKSVAEIVARYQLPAAG